MEREAEREGHRQMPRKAPTLRSKGQGGILPWSTWREGCRVSTGGLDSVTMRECVAVVLSLPVCGDL